MDSNENATALETIVLDDVQLAMLRVAIGSIDNGKLALAQVRLGTILASQEGDVFDWQPIEYDEGTKTARSCLGAVLSTAQGSRFDDRYQLPRSKPPSGRWESGVCIALSKCPVPSSKDLFSSTRASWDNKRLG
jgi:hypothetical protein